MSNRVYTIGICGGSASGKSTLASRLRERIGPGACVVLAMDNFYKDFVSLGIDPETVNYDHPASIEIPALAEVIRRLEQGLSCCIPEYDFVFHTRKDCSFTVSSLPFLIVEGLFLFSVEELAPYFNLKIYVDTLAETRLNRRIERDMASRGRSRESVIQQFRTTVEPMHERFVEPNRELADMVVRGDEPFTKPIEDILKELGCFQKQAGTDRPDSGL